MTFIEIDLAEYTSVIINQTVIAFSIALALLMVLNYSISFGLWWYQKKVENK